MVWVKAKAGEFDNLEESRTYSEFISSDDWKQIREQIIEDRGKVCENCGKTFSKYNLNIHHRHYDNDFGYENEQDLMVLCKVCHFEMHKDND